MVVANHCALVVARIIIPFVVDDGRVTWQSLCNPNYRASSYPHHQKIVYMDVYSYVCLYMAIYDNIRPEICILGVRTYIWGVWAHILSVWTLKSQQTIKNYKNSP